MFIILFGKVEYHDKIKVDPQFIKATLGETVYLNCVSLETVSWNFEGKRIPSNGDTGKNRETQDKWLRLRNVRLNNQGTYTCLFEKDFIVGMASATLEVMSKCLC